MTCIVGVQTSNGVVIGGDSAGVAGYVLTHRADPKVFRNGSYLIGFTTSFRMGQLIRYADLPKPLDRTADELDRFMATDFVEGIRASLKAGGYAKKDSDREEGGCFLVGVSGRLFRVEGDYQVGRTIDDYQACGCGDEVAYGSLYATRDSGLSPRKRVTLALKAAAHHSTGVAGPFTVLRDTSYGTCAP